jgi:hypothetical protein
VIELVFYSGHLVLAVHHLPLHYMTQGLFTVLATPYSAPVLTFYLPFLQWSFSRQKLHWLVGSLF